MPVQMGNSTSALINKNQGSHSTRREVEDVLNRLVVLSEVKATTHYQRVVKYPIDADILPIEKVVRRLQVVHCCIKQNANVVKEAVNEYLGQYFKAEILEGLTAIICQTLDRLISSTSDKNSSEMTSYAITIGKNGGIGRIDCYMFYYKLRSPDLDVILDNCLVTSLIVSKCDATKLHIEDMPFLAEAAHSATLPGGKQEDAAARVEKIQNMLLHELQQSFRNKSAPI